MKEVPEGEGVSEVNMVIHGTLYRVFTIKEFADMTDYSVRYVRDMCDAGKLIATKYGGMWWVVDANYEFITSNNVPFRP